METIYDLMYFMGKRPGMYVGDNITLQAIKNYVAGYIASSAIHNNLTSEEKKFIDQFDEWVRIKLMEQTGIQLDLHRNYYYYISTVYSDEQERIASFFKLVQDFKEIMMDKDCC